MRIHLDRGAGFGKALKRPCVAMSLPFRPSDGTGGVVRERDGSGESGPDDAIGKDLEMRTTILITGLLAGLAGGGALAQETTPPDAGTTAPGVPQQPGAEDLRTLMEEMRELMGRMGGMPGHGGAEGMGPMGDARMDGPHGGDEMGRMGDVPNTAPLALAIYDTDGDGRITAEEIEARKAARFAEADADGDGGLSPEELVALDEAIRMEVQLARAAQRIERFDDNGDGLLQSEEIEARTPRIAPIFDRLDTDGDGGISQEELGAVQGGHGGFLGRLMGGHGRHHGD